MARFDRDKLLEPSLQVQEPLENWNGVMTISTDAIRENSLLLITHSLGDSSLALGSDQGCECR